MQNTTAMDLPVDRRGESRRGPKEPASSAPDEVLLVEDNPEYAALVERALQASRPPMRVRRASSLGEALDRTREWTPAAILLDLTLPDAEPDTTILHAGGLAQRAPLFVLTAHSDRGAALEALSAGVDDYFVKEHLDPRDLARELREALGRRVERAARAAEVLDVEAFRAELARRCRAGGAFALSFVELDHFDTLRERWGDAWAFRMRRSATEVLAASLGEGDVLAHMGEARFAVLHPQEVLSTSFGIPSAPLPADVSHRELFSAQANCGTAWFPEDGAHADTLLARAEARCRQPYERDSIDLRIRLSAGA